MKHTLIIFALLTATIQTFAQSPRIKLNQITKDSLAGSVLISSPTDSGMVYSRDLYISYGVSDTVLILNGDTLAATSGIISSVLSDGVTIVGDGTTGSELTADTSVLATLRALSDSLALVISSVTTDNVTITGDGTVGSPLTVDTTTYIATKGDLDLKQDQLNGTGFVKATGTTISYDNSTYLTTEVDGSTTNELQTISTSGAAGNITLSDGGGTLNLNVNDADASTTNEIQDISTTGAAGNISISSGSTLNLNVDDADASATNEGSLTVGAGTASTSVISSNTSGSTDVTLTAGTNVTLSESGNNITIAATGGGTTYNNITETADTLYIKKYLDVDTSTLHVDATNNRVGIGTSTPSATMDIRGQTIIRPESTTSADIEFAIQERTFADGSTFGMIEKTSDNGLTFIVDSTGIGLFMDFLGTKNTISDVGNDGDYVMIRFMETNVIGVQNDLIFDNPQGDILIDYSGRGGTKIGIGTSTPSYKLDVNGNVRADTYYYDVTSTLQSSSDARLKQNITDMDNVLDKLKELELVKYQWNDNMYKKLEGRTSQSKLGGTFEGMIAQQVESLFPQYVGEDADGYKTLSYVSFVIPLLKGFQEQQAIIEQQATEIETLKSQIQLILTEIEQIKNN